MSFPTHEEWSRAHHLRLMRKFRSSSKIMDFDLAYDGCRSKGRVLFTGWSWWVGSSSFGRFSAKDTLLFEGSMSMLVFVGFEGFIVVENVKNRDNLFLVKKDCGSCERQERNDCLYFNSDTLGLTTAASRLIKRSCKVAVYWNKFFTETIVLEWSRTYILSFFDGFLTFFFFFFFFLKGASID